MNKDLLLMQKTHQNYLYQSGMALVTVIVFSAVGLIVIVAGITLSIITSQSSRNALEGQQALMVAEAGMENALIRILRDPNYIHEELTVGDGTVRIDVTNGGNNRTVRSEGRFGSSIRVVEVLINEENGMMVIENWREVFNGL